MTKITAYAASMFRASTNYINPGFIGITPPPESPKKRSKAKRKGRTEAQKIARREREQKRKQS